MLIIFHIKASLRAIKRRLVMDHRESVKIVPKFSADGWFRLQSLQFLERNSAELGACSFLERRNRGNAGRRLRIEIKNALSSAMPRRGSSYTTAFLGHYYQSN